MKMNIQPVTHRTGIRALHAISVCCLLVLFLLPLALVPEAYSQEEPQPKIEFSEKLWDFGTLIQGEDATHIFTVRNAGDEDLKIGQIRTSCGCTAAMIDSKNISPGDESRIKVTYSTRGRRGKQTNRVYVESNDPDTSRATLSITCLIEVPPQPVIKPSSRTLDFGPLNEGDIAGGTLTITNAGEKELSVTGLEASPGCKVELLSSSVLSPGDKGTIKITVDRVSESGVIQKYVKIRSNDPNTPTLVIVVIGYVRGKAETSEKSNEDLWDFGVISKGEKLSHVFRILNGGSSDLTIERIRRSRYFQAKLLSPATIGPGETAEIEVSVNTRFLLGTFNRRLYFTANGRPRRLTVIGYIKDDEPESTEMEPKAQGGQRYPDANIQPTRMIKDEKPDGKVRMFMFYAEDCEDCKAVKDISIPRLREMFPSLIEIKFFNIDKTQDYNLLVKLEERYKDTGNQVPIIFIGDRVLGGRKEVEEGLIPMTEKYVSEGGSQWPVAEKSPREVGHGQRLEPALAEKEKVVYLAYFFQPGCKKCDRVRYMLKNLKHGFPNLVIKDFNNNVRDNQQLQEAISVISNLPKARRLIAPTVFIGRDYLVGNDIADSALDRLVRSYLKEGSPCPWEEARAGMAQGDKTIIERFKSFSPLAIAGAGLLDGINPCAFTTLIFFVSYLAFIKRKGREILIVGLTFTLSVFTTYLLVGLGAFRVIQALTVFSLVARIFYFITAAFALTLGILSLYDYIKFRAGKIKEMKLQLPKAIKDRIHTTIRKKSQMRNYVLAALVTGCLVSLLELACTGQVYLPTIAFVTGVPDLRMHAVMYLVLYNVMFIVPLVVVFLLTTYGTTSEQLANIMIRHLGKIKIGTSLLFFGLAALLIFILI